MEQHRRYQSTWAAKLELLTVKWLDSESALLAILDAAAVQGQRGDPLVSTSGAATALRGAIKAHLRRVAFVP